MRTPRWPVWMLLCACAGRPAAEVGMTSSTTATQPTGALHASCLDDDGVILSTPDTQGYRRYANQGFTRYTEVVAPNGGTIPIFAQDKVRDSQLMRARNLLRFFLTDVPGSAWGEDKSDVANAMADNNAVLMMPNGEHEEGNEPDLPAQPLYEDETPADGSGWFMNNNFDPRTLRLRRSFISCTTWVSAPGSQACGPNIRRTSTQARAAIQDGRWDPGRPLCRSGSTSSSVRTASLRSTSRVCRQLLRSVGTLGRGRGRHVGDLHRQDACGDRRARPAGLALLEQFLPPTISTEIRLDDRLRRDFSMRFDASEPYTHKSQYFVHVTLTGDADVALYGNAYDNTLRGNAGDNTIDGAGGEDTVVYCGPRSDYTVVREADALRVSGPDGSDRLVDVEWVHFAGGRVAADAL